MSTFGRTSVQSVGRSIKVTADGRPEMKAAGVTLDWALVAAVTGADVTLEDGVVVKIGEKYVRYGQLLTKVTTGGKYGPYDPAAADGRQTLARGNAYLVLMTVKENDLRSDHPPVMDGGRVFKDRLLATTGAASLAAGPTFANLETLFPRITYVAETPI
jgi:hypothetical protein